MVNYNIIIKLIITNYYYLKKVNKLKFNNCFNCLKSGEHAFYLFSENNCYKQLKNIYRIVCKYFNNICIVNTFE